MEGTEQALLLILSGALAVFLALGIFALVKLIQVLNHLKRISEKAERIAESAESVSDFFRYSAGPAAIGRFLANISDIVLRKARKNKED